MKLPHFYQKRRQLMLDVKASFTLSTTPRMRSSRRPGCSVDSLHNAAEIFVRSQ